MENNDYTNEWLVKHIYTLNKDIMKLTHEKELYDTCLSLDTSIRKEFFEGKYDRMGIILPKNYFAYKKSDDTNLDHNLRNCMLFKGNRYSKELISRFNNCDELIIYTKDLNENY